MWDILTGFFLTQAVGRSRAVRVLVLLLLLGGLFAGLIYAAVVFKALDERSNSRHVHTHSSY